VPLSRPYPNYEWAERTGLCVEYVAFSPRLAVEHITHNGTSRRQWLPPSDTEDLMPPTHGRTHLEKWLWDTPGSPLWTSPRRVPSQ